MAMVTSLAPKSVTTARPSSPKKACEPARLSANLPEKKILPEKELERALDPVSMTDPAALVRAARDVDPTIDRRTILAISLTKIVMAADSRPDVAQIINKAEASAILGRTVKDPSQRSGDGTDGYYSKCNYYSVQRGKSLIIRLQLRTERDRSAKRTSAVGGSERHDGKVSDVGDAAQMFTGGGKADSLRKC